MLPAFPIIVLGDDERESTLREVGKGKVGVVDFWHTKCQKCPAGLDKFNSEYEQFNSEEVVFIACAISLGAGNKDDVACLGPETWENVTHVFVEESVKDQAKEAFGYSAVPFYAVFDKNGTIVTKGDSKAVDYVAEVKKLLANGGVAPLESAPAGGALALDEDF